MTFWNWAIGSEPSGLVLLRYAEEQLRNGPPAYLVTEHERQAWVRHQKELIEAHKRLAIGR